MQWVLQQAPPKGGDLEALVVNGIQTRKPTLHLADGWRRKDDLSWRASTWGLRRFALGGMRLVPLPDGDPAISKLPKPAIGLRIAHVGQYAPHDVAKRAGFQIGDVIVSFDGKTDLPRETDVLAYALDKGRRTQDVPVEVLRGAETLTLKLPSESK